MLCTTPLLLVFSSTPLLLLLLEFSLGSARAAKAAASLARLPTLMVHMMISDPQLVGETRCVPVSWGLGVLWGTSHHVHIGIGSSARHAANFAAFGGASTGLRLLHRYGTSHGMTESLSLGKLCILCDLRSNLYCLVQVATLQVAV